MHVFLSTTETTGITIGVILGSLALVVGFILLYIFVIRRQRMKKQIRDIEKKYSYLSSLLIGQDTQYIHRIEIISRSNLLYLEKHDYFSRVFNEIIQNDDKYVISMIKQLNALVENKQFKNLKDVINKGKKAVADFEEKVNDLDEKLYALIKPEEDTRHAILKLKETYRRVKQSFYTNSSDLDLASSSFLKVFDKLDLSFTDFENKVESAAYDEAQNMIPQVQKVITAVESCLVEMPNLCILVTSIVPEKVASISKEFSDAEKQGLPLYNLTFKTKLANWNETLETLKNKLINLQTANVANQLEDIQNQIEEMRISINKEIDDKQFFTANLDIVYRKAIELEKAFLKYCSLIPEISKIYKIEQSHQDDFDTLKETVEKVGHHKRLLDNYIHSNTRQPFSVLKNKLDDLSETYEKGKAGMSDFKAYLDSLKSLSQEAFELVFVYYYRLKQVETLLRDMKIDSIYDSYQARINDCFELVNSIDIIVKNKPIDVLTVSQKVEELKTNANRLFDEIEEKNRLMQLAESSIVYANRDRKHQSDVDQQLAKSETMFFAGEFDKVYQEVNRLFKNSHVEDVDDVE